MKKYNNGLVFNFSNDVNKKYVVLDSIEKNDDTYLFCAPMGNEDSIRYEDGIILKIDEYTNEFDVVDDIDIINTIVLRYLEKNDLIQE